MKMKMLGGPEDGAVQDLPPNSPVEIEVSGPRLTWAADAESPERSGCKMYRYRSNPRRQRVEYQGERIAYDDEPEKGVMR